jgi:hypothetical protein
VAAGDSLRDRDMLAAVAAGVRPAHGELHDRGWHAEHVTVTDASGVRAGEQIAARLIAHVLST